MKKYLKQFSCFLLFAAMTIPSVVMAANKPPDGKLLFGQKGCAICHGKDGAMPVAPFYPILAGQRELYLIDELNDIRSGQRNNGRSSLMVPFVAALNEDEIKAIAQYLSTQKGV